MTSTTVNKITRFLPSARAAIIAIPYAWLLMFFAIPFAIVFKISFAEAVMAMPPFTDLITFAGDQMDIKLNIGNYMYLVNDRLYYIAYKNSVIVAFFSTFWCLVIGYPMAYAIVRCNPQLRNVLLLLIILPSWTSFLIRVYAWLGLMKNNGLINGLLLWMGVIDSPLQILYTPMAVYIGIVYTYMPYMLLPLYGNISKLDGSLIEAASDLGATPIKTFIYVTLPLTKGGIIAGSLLVFIPAVGEFVIPELLGGSSTIMIGRVLWQEFFNNRDWPVASAVAIVMLVLLVVPIAYYQKVQIKNMEEGNGF